MISNPLSSCWMKSRRQTHLIDILNNNNDRFRFTLSNICMYQSHLFYLQIRYTRNLFQSMAQPNPDPQHISLAHGHHEQSEPVQFTHMQLQVSKQIMRNNDSDGNNSQDNRQNIRVKRYDYLNKYNQHDLMVKFSEAANSRQYRIVKHQLNREQSDKKQERKRSALSSNVGNIRVITTLHNQATSKPKPKSQSRSSSKNSSKSKIKPAHYMYMKAYQNNIPTFAYDPFQQESLGHVKLLDRQRQQRQGSGSEVNRLLSRIPNFTNGLASQIQHQNQIYKGQIIEYKTLVNTLQTELDYAREQARIVDQNCRKEILCYETVVKELKQEIIVLKSRQIANQHGRIRDNFVCLNNDDRDNDKDKENICTQNKQEGNSTINFNRSLQKGTIKKVQAKSAQKFTNLEKYILQRIQMIFSCCENKASSLSSVKVSHSLEEALSRIQKLVQQNKKYESLIFNIKEMQRKIEKDREILYGLQIKGGEPTTRQLWKWLKILGSSYSFMQEIKPLLGKRIGLDQQQSRHKHLKQIIEKMLICT